MSDILNTNHKKSIHEEQVKVFSKHIDELKQLQTLVGIELKKQKDISASLERKLDQGKVSLDTQKMSETKTKTSEYQADNALGRAKANEVASKEVRDNLTMELEKVKKEAEILVKQRGELASVKLDLNKRIHRIEIAEATLLREKANMEEEIRAKQLGVKLGDLNLGRSDG